MLWFPKMARIALPSYFLLGAFAQFPVCDPPVVPLPTAFQGSASSLLPNATLPFGLKQLNGTYSLDFISLTLASLPLLVNACIRQADALPIAGGGAAISLGSAPLAPFRLCVIFGTKPDPSGDGSTVAAFNLSNTFAGACTASSFPTAYAIDDYVLGPPPAAVTTCPGPVQAMPLELRGTAETSASLIPFSLPIPIPLGGVTSVDENGVAQSLFFKAVTARLCLHNVTRLSYADMQGTTPPPNAPSAAAKPGYSWWRVVFGNPATHPGTSTCALMARTPSATVVGKDDLVAAIGIPGGHCPTVWTGPGLETNVTVPGFYVGSANSALRSAVGWGKLALALFVALLGFVLLSPAPML